MNSTIVTLVEHRTVVGVGIVSTVNFSRAGEAVNRYIAGYRYLAGNGYLDGCRFVAGCQYVAGCRYVAECRFDASCRCIAGCMSSNDHRLSSWFTTNQLTIDGCTLYLIVRKSIWKTKMVPTLYFVFNNDF